MVHSQKNIKSIILSASFLVYKFTGVGKSRFTVVRMEKDMQVMIITITLLTQKNVTMAQCTWVQSHKCSKCRPSLFTHSFRLFATLEHTLAHSSLLSSVSWHASLMQRIISSTVRGFREKTLSWQHPKRISYCNNHNLHVFFHTNNSKPSFAHPCIFVFLSI
jgi:hypothetical protein